MTSRPLDQRALVVIAAALDGHDPGMRQLDDGTMQLDPTGGASDLDHAIADLLDGVDNTHFTVKELARVARDAVDVTARHYGHPDAPPRTRFPEIADALRERLRMLNEARADEDEATPW